jgi:hypothetical protein
LGERHDLVAQPVERVRSGTEAVKLLKPSADVKGVLL